MNDLSEARKIIDRVDGEMARLFCERMRAVAMVARTKKEKGLPISVPENYFPDDDDTKDPIVRWRSCANLLYTNWLNYFVYQSTPDNIEDISD